MIGTILGLGGFTLHAQPPSPDAGIDRHALAATKEVEESLNRLVDYLVRPARNDRDKARAIFRWMTDRLRYDTNAFFTSHPGEMHPDMVLRDREATCYGYAALFEAMARRAGLETITIHGHAKLKHHTEEGRLMKVPHAWNAVRLDGSWYLLDTTWGSGFLKGQRWHRVLHDQYFLTPPALLVLTHLPTDPRNQLLPVPMMPAQFDAMPLNDARFLRMGINHETSWQHMDAPQGRIKALHSNTQTYLQAGKVKLLTAPPAGSVPCWRDCYFVVEAPEVVQMALWNNGQWTLMHKSGTRFEGLIRPEPGEMRLCLQRPQDTNFQVVRTYKVSEK